MKICFLTISMRAGGAERVMSILANEFVHQGHEVSFLNTDGEHIMAYSMDSSVEVEYVEPISLRSAVKFRKCCRSIKTRIQEIQPDVIIAFFYSTILPWLMLRTKVPLIFSERNDPKANNTGNLDRILRSLSMSKAEGIVFQTKKVQSYYGESVVRKSTVIMNPFDAGKLPQTRSEQRRKEVVAVGRLMPQKNYPLLLEAFSIVNKKHPDYCLKIYGGGPLKESLTELAALLGISDSVHFMGVSEDVLNEIKDSSVYVLSSEFEGIPNALLEAMALGLPCISTNYRPEAVNELIQDRVNGIIVPRGNAQAMAAAINGLIENEELARTMGKNAAAILDRIRCEKIAQEWIAFIQKVIKGDK